MDSKTIKISKENYVWLLKLAGSMQKKMNRPVTFDDTLSSLKEKGMNKNNKDLMKLAGSWKMSDKEADRLLNNIYKERKISSRRL